MVDRFSERRLKENEVIFQQANRGVADFVLEDIGKDDAVIEFYCECSNIDCRDRIPLQVSDYRKLHKDQRHFIALKGHEMPDIETIVSRHGGFSVVRKYGDIPSVTDIGKALPDIAASL
jgi:hypothetical protein